MSKASPTGTPSPWRRVAGRWVILIWLAALLVLPYAMSLYPRSSSQAAAGLLFAIFILAEWAIVSPNPLQRGGGQGQSGRVTPGPPTLALALMTLISFLDIVYFVPYVDARVRSLAGPGSSFRVYLAMQKIIDNVEAPNGRLSSLAALVQSGAITPEDLRPAGMSIAPDPQGLEEIKRAIATSDKRALSNAVSRYSIFRYLPGKAVRIGRAAPIPLVISKKLHDLQFGWVRLLGFSDGEIVEVVASPWSCSGSGPITGIMHRGQPGY